MVFYLWSNISGLSIVDCQFENDKSYENWESAVGKLAIHEKHRVKNIVKLTAIISLLAMMLLGSTANALAQEKSCSFDIVGTWKAQVSSTEARLYHFDANGVVTVLSLSGTGEPHRIVTAKYDVIDEVDAPKVGFVYCFRQGPDIRSCQKDDGASQL